MSKTLSYCITVKDELDELIRLLNFLQLRITPNDEIVIQYDADGVTPEVLDYLNLMKQMHKNHIVVGFPLNKDFATFKNNLTKVATKEFILQLDADEMPHEFLIENLSTILESNNVDLIFLPRVNTVDGITPEHIKKWGWNVNDKGWINWPDYQSRLYRRTDDIQWMGKVHERITGYDTVSNFPASEEWSLYHPKDIKRQERQNDFYNTI